jgi:hypothetical protein
MDVWSAAAAGMPTGGSLTFEEARTCTTTIPEKEDDEARSEELEAAMLRADRPVGSMRSGRPLTRKPPRKVSTGPWRRNGERGQRRIGGWPSSTRA